MPGLMVAAFGLLHTGTKVEVSPPVGETDFFEI